MSRIIKKRTEQTYCLSNVIKSSLLTVERLEIRLYEHCKFLLSFELNLDLIMFKMLCSNVEFFLFSKSDFPIVLYVNKIFVNH